jgi:hypothetical protein
MKKANRVVVFIPLVLISIFSGVILYSVMAGSIGNREIWRIICAICSFLIFSGMTLLFILKSKL